MPNYSYLMKYFQEKDRILLYGGGKNGREIYQFLKRQHHLRPVGLVDQNAERLDGWDIPVYRPDQLKIIPPETYDKVIITVMSQNAGIEIYRMIQDAEIEDKKIIAPYSYLGPVSRVTPEDFARDGLSVKREIKKFLDEKYGSLVFFEPLIQRLKGQGGRRNMLLPQAKKALDCLSPLESVVFLYVLYSADVFDAELMERLMDCLLEIDGVHLRQFLYGVWNDTTFMCFHHVEYLFPAFYIKRRILLKKVCEMFDFSLSKYSERQSERECIKKICIVSRCFHASKRDADATMLLCIQLVGLLAGWGYDIQLILLDPVSYLMETPVFPPIFQWYDTSSSYIAEYEKELPSQVSIITSDLCDLKERLQNALDGIFSYSPDLIIDMSDEMSVLSYLYSQYFQTLYLPMRGYQSSSFFTYFAARERAIFARENSIYHSVDESAFVKLPICVFPPEPQTVYKRRDFLLEDHDFVLVTVGARLETEMSSEFIDAICSRLLPKPNIKWAIVGSTNHYLSQTYADYISCKKIIYMPYERDLPAFYKLCDLFINPERMGGGASITWAMHYGLPVATLSVPNDVMPVIGTENVMENYDQMMDYVLTLWSDPVCWKQNSEKFQKLAFQFEADLPERILKALSKIEKSQKNRKD